MLLRVGERQIVVAIVPGMGIEHFHPAQIAGRGGMLAFPVGMRLIQKHAHLLRQRAAVSRRAGHGARNGQIFFRGQPHEQKILHAAKKADFRAQKHLNGAPRAFQRRAVAPHLDFHRFFRRPAAFGHFRQDKMVCDGDGAVSRPRVKAGHLRARYVPAAAHFAGMHVRIHFFHNFAPIPLYPPAFCMLPL